LRAFAFVVERQFVTTGYFHSFGYIEHRLLVI
jgi:hypothetical protein